MRVLVACEFSGVVRRAFREKGHDAWSCDLLPALDDSEYHIEGDLLGNPDLGIKPILQRNWDLMIAHPPCTYLSSSGLHWNKRIEGRQQKTEEALEFVKLLMDSSIPRICVENPVGCISSRIRPPDQYIQPYEFGEDASKKTGLWLKNLPLLQGTKFVLPTHHGNKYYANQTPSGQNKLGPSSTRGYDRSVTYEGIAKAMANQWSL